MDLDRVYKTAKIIGAVALFAAQWAVMQYRLTSIESLLIEHKSEFREVSRATIENAERIAILEDRSNRRR